MLLEEAFRPDHSFPFSNSPLLRQVGVFLWTLSYGPVFPENVTGFVWVEDGRIVGNVTLSLDETRLDRYLISNVAVLPSYQHRGIAGKLMQISLDHLRTRGVKWALLNVRPDNPGAVHLYKSLGFVEIEMRGEWKMDSSRLSSLRLAPRAELWDKGAASDGLYLRSYRLADRRAAGALVRAATPADVQQFRPPYVRDFELDWQDRWIEALADLLAGQRTWHRLLERAGQPAALLIVRGQRLATPHRFSIEVHPDFIGNVEADLVAVSLHHLRARPAREIRVPASDRHPELIAALEQSGFTFVSGLTLMALAL